MIFVTVGEQLPFDRLIKTVDHWAAQTNYQIFAQIGRTKLAPQNLDYQDFLAQERFKQLLSQADLIVAHAGMGSIISALEMNKPIIVMPRSAALGEHRNDHQLATAKRFLSLQYVSVAFDEAQLFIKLTEFEKKGPPDTFSKIYEPSHLLIQTIRDFLKNSKLI